MLRHLPLKNPQPDAKKFIDILMGRAKSTRSPLVEFIVDDVVMRPIVTDLLGRRWIAEASDCETQKAYLDNFIESWYRLGYDFVRFERGLPFPMKQTILPDPVPGSDKLRAWADQHEGSIRTWEDFERYPWPTIEQMDFFPFEYLNSHLPEGMGLMSSHAGGILEHLSWIMSFEGLCFALHDDPGLVKAVADKLGELMTGFYKHLLDLPHLIAVFPGDDMGFRTGTLVSPDTLRELVLPWHKRFAAMAHAKGLPYFLHSCGNVLKIMEDLITDVGIDGKHSYEDVIIPVQEFQARYGDRIAVLGGLDVNILAASSPDQVREKARFLIETCGSRGRYALGSGNSIPSYVPVANYLAMLDEVFEVIIL
ncbi:MAG: uroporphyrinogen decarboxylase family protein [Chloroflexota bacterium]